MNAELELKLQAWLDGELSKTEARQMAELAHRDPEAQSLVTELRTTRDWLSGNELEMAVPETREFYWSKIERGIDREEARAEQPAGIPGWRQWFKYFAPAAAIAVAVGLGILLVKPSGSKIAENPSHYLAETENLSEYTTSFAFHSEEENMFVVWISQKDSPAKPERETESSSTLEGIYQ